MAAGDFVTFVTASSPTLLRATSLMTRNASAAAELVQAALEKVYVAWRRIDRGGRARPRPTNAAQRAHRHHPQAIV